jgi:hypothetical protein
VSNQMGSAPDVYVHDQVGLNSPGPLTCHDSSLAPTGLFTVLIKKSLKPPSTWVAFSPNQAAAGQHCPCLGIGAGSTARVLLQAFGQLVHNHGEFVPLVLSIALVVFLAFWPYFLGAT